MYIGNHLSSAKGYEAMGKQAVRLGGETFAFLPEIQEVERQKRLSLRMWKNFRNCKRAALWKDRGTRTLYDECLCS